MNALAKHTPGPWSVSDGLVRLEDQIDQLLRDVGSDKEWIPVVIRDGDGECGVTALCHPVNAHLIAAAPEMAAALLALVDTTNAHCPVDHPALPLARSILRKAGLLS